MFLPTFIIAVYPIKGSPELQAVWNYDLQIIRILLAYDKYLIYLRKLKHLKNEAVKANIAAATREKEKEKERNNKSSTDEVKSDSFNSSEDAKKTQTSKSRTDDSTTKKNKQGKKSNDKQSLNENSDNQLKDAPESLTCNNKLEEKKFHEYI